jgi:hypothetical protein
MSTNSNQGLRGSQHKPPPPPPTSDSAPDGSTQGPAKVKVKGLLEAILALVPVEQKGIARGLASQIQTLVNDPKDDQFKPTLTTFRKVVAEEVRAALGEARKASTQGQTWAAAVAVAIMTS